MNDIRLYKYYFFNQQGTFVEQTPKGGYLNISRRFSNRDFQNHFSGIKTYATRLVSYKPRLSGHTVIHITNSKISSLNRLMEGASDAGVYFNQMISEYTGGLGYRLWLRYLYPIEADRATAVGERILKLSKMEGQVFPERDTRSENIVILPLGIDKKYGQRSYLFDAGLHPVEDFAAYLYTLDTINHQESYFLAKKHESLNKN